MDVSDVSAASSDELTAPSAYSRNATGLVREVGLKDMMLFTAPSAGGGVGFAVAFGIFVALSEFPRANIIVALLIAIGISFGPWLACALLAATMPKTGGDYIYGSRLLHPIIGLGSNIAAFVSFLGFAAVNLYLIVSLGFQPAFQLIGNLTGTHWWLDAATTIGQRGWTLAITIGLLAVLTALSIFGTRIVVRTMSISFMVGFFGFVVTMLILLFTSHHSFVSHLNAFSAPLTHTPDTYGATINAAAKGGLTFPSEHGYLVSATIGALIISLGNMGSTNAIYLTGEFKGASNRRRQLWVQVGTGVIQQIMVILGAILVLSVIGYNFLAAANAGAFAPGIATGTNFFAAIASNSTFVAVLTAVAFLGWFLPNGYVNLAMAQRSPFAWAFDGLIPRRTSAVNDRTHTPVTAIMIAFVLASAAAVWCVYSKSFFTVLSTFLVLFFETYVVIGLSAALMPWRHPEVYRNSPADWKKILGVPVVVWAGALCAFEGALAIGLTIHFYKQVGYHNVWVAILLPIVSFVIAAVIYLAAKAIHAARGLDLGIVYKTLPPD